MCVRAVCMWIYRRQVYNNIRKTFLFEQSDVYLSCNICGWDYCCLFRKLIFLKHICVSVCIHFIFICDFQQHLAQFISCFKCKANSCLPKSMSVTDGTVSVCDTSTGTCKCGKAKNKACISGTTTPACRVTSTGKAPTLESEAANCQVIIFFKQPAFTRI